MAQSTERDVRMEIHGMTCTSCEEHVVDALTQAGAQGARADFRRGEARFRLPAGVEASALDRAVEAAGYKPGELEYLGATTAVASRSGGEGQYDLVIIGSGGAAFSAAIQARNNGARVVMIERGTMGGTCVNIGCVPSKTLLRAGEIYFNSRNHPFAGVPTSAGPVDLGLLTGQKDKLV